MGQAADKGEAAARRAADTAGPAASLLVEGETCWRVTRARRAALLIDGAAYFTTLARVLERAERSIWVLGWDINSALSLDPDRGLPGLAAFLEGLLEAKPALVCRMLIWDWILAYSLDRETLPALKFGSWRLKRLRFVLDGAHPATASQHEKIVVVDRATAFCGGIDLAPGRFDTPAHPARDPRRDGAMEEPQPPFHDVMLLIEGEAAAALEDLARERWEAATGERPAPTHPVDPPPSEGEAAEFGDIRLGIARTRPAYEGRPGAREVEALHLAAIRAAKRFIYIENQYFTAESVGEALAQRLAEADAPEIVVVSTKSCDGMLETAVMNSRRARLIQKLAGADKGGRFACFYAERDAVAGGDGRPIKIHAKLMIVDDRWLILGSTNLANRSMGLDTETSVVIEAEDKATETAIAQHRLALIAEHLGREPGTVDAEAARQGGLLPAIQALADGPARLTPVPTEQDDVVEELAPLARLADTAEPLTMDRAGDVLAILSEQRSLGAMLVRFGAGLGLVALILLTLVSGDAGTGDLTFRLLEAFRTVAERIDGAMLLLVVAVGLNLLFVPLNLLVGLLAAASGFGTGLAGGLAIALGSAVLGYALGRIVGLGLLRRIAGRRVNVISRRVARYPMGAVALLRLIPPAPFAFVNLVAGATRVGPGRFVLGSAVGALPGLVLMALVGDRLGVWLRDPDILNLAIVLATAALTTFAGRWLRKRYRDRITETSAGRDASDGAAAAAGPG